MKDDCEKFETWLWAVSSGEPTGDSADRAAREHRDSCASCRSYEMAIKDSDEGVPRAPVDFARQVLQRTSGSACEQAHQELSTALEGPRGQLDRVLLDAHLEHCNECRSFERVLGEVLTVLPAMARITPRPEFTAAVLSQTSEKPRLRDRLTPLQWVAAAWQRPRFALEVGFVGAVMIWLLIALPVSPLHGSPSTALDRLRDPGTTTVLAETRAQAIGLGNRAWSATSTGSRESAARLRADLVRGRVRTEARGAAIIGGLRAFARAVSAGDRDSAMRALTRITIELGTPLDSAASDQQETERSETERTQT